MEYVATLWQWDDARLATASGKTALSELSKWTQSQFGVAFGPPAIARQMKQSELPAELTGVIRAIEEGSSFRPADARLAWVEHVSVEK